MNRGALELSGALAEKGSQARLADELKIDQGYLSKVERAERVPGLEVRKKLRERLGIALDAWDEEVTSAEPHEEPAPESVRTGPAVPASGTDGGTP